MYAAYQYHQKFLNISEHFNLTEFDDKKVQDSSKQSNSQTQEAELTEGNRKQKEIKPFTEQHESIGEGKWEELGQRCLRTID